MIGRWVTLGELKNGPREGTGGGGSDFGEDVGQSIGQLDYLDSTGSEVIDRE